MTDLNLRLRRLAGALCAAALLVLPASAQDVDGIVSIDVLDGWTEADGARMAGLRVRLAPGWKTYWRAPGDAGIPPHFDWAGSANLKGVRLHWPTPVVFLQQGLRSIGYTGEVVLPVELIPRDPGQPVTLAGTAAMGVCQDICVPVQLDISGDALLGTGEGPGAAVIRRALGHRPARSAAQASCTLSAIEDGLRLRVSLPIADLGREAVVVELDRPGTWVSDAVAHREGGLLVAEADLVPPEGAPFALDRSALRFTVLGARGAADLRGCRAD